MARPLSILTDRAKNRRNPPWSLGNRQQRHPCPVAKRMTSDRKTITRDVRSRCTKTFHRHHRLSDHENVSPNIRRCGCDFIPIEIPSKFLLVVAAVVFRVINSSKLNPPLVQLRAPRPLVEVPSYEGELLRMQSLTQPRKTMIKKIRPPDSVQRAYDHCKWDADPTFKTDYNCI